ncbi:MAG: hypothetical protein JNL08_10585 [Planctomycetes bacterium]|nr:hypothetical protein [Planctomycetota bacterium]
MFWNLHVARTIAEQGLPAAVPQAAFTQLAVDHADRQWLFSLVLAAYGGRDLGLEHVPPLVLGFALAKLAVLLACARWLVGPRLLATPVLLAFGLSASALFRAAALRDMLLAILPLLVLLARLARCDARPKRNDQAWLAGAALVFTWSHGAPVLPLALAVVVGAGRRLDTGRCGFRTLLPIGAGVLLGLLARPNPLGCLELLWTLNVFLPWASATGALPLHPTEFAAPPFDLLLAHSWPLLLAAGLSLATAWRRRADWRLVLPAVLLAIGTVFGARLVELAAPCLTLAVLVQLAATRLGGTWRGELAAAAVAIGLLGLAHHHAQPSLDANRLVALADVGDDLRQRARPGDVVFVTDWGVSSPLTWFTRDVPLRFTGITDPVLMLRAAPDAFAAWWRIKSAADPEAARTIRERFGARFAVIGFADAAPGRPAGETAVQVWQTFGALAQRGVAVQSRDVPSPPRHATLEPGFRLYEFTD